MTAFCGLSKNYVQLLIGRIGVGVGEAGGTPGASSIISDYFPAAKRPMALTVFSLGAPIGAWLGADIAGIINDAYRLAHGVPRAGRSGHRRRPVDLPDRPRAPSRAARPQGRRSQGCVVRREHALPLDAEIGRARDDRERRDRALGLGPDVVDAHVPDPQLCDDAGRGGRHRRADSPGRRGPRDAADRLVDGATIHAGPAPHRPHDGHVHPASPRSSRSSSTGRTTSGSRAGSSGSSFRPSISTSARASACSRTCASRACARSSARRRCSSPTSAT